MRLSLKARGSCCTCGRCGLGSDRFVPRNSSFFEQIRPSWWAYRQRFRNASGLQVLWSLLEEYLKRLHNLLALHSREKALHSRISSRVHLQFRKRVIAHTFVKPAYFLHISSSLFLFLTPTQFAWLLNSFLCREQWQLPFYPGPYLFLRQLSCEVLFRDSIVFSLIRTIVRSRIVFPKTKWDVLSSTIPCNLSAMIDRHNMETMGWQSKLSIKYI